MISVGCSLALTFCVLLNGAQLALCQSSQESTLLKLREHLLKGYDATVRPVLDHTKATLVTCSIAPIHIADMDEKQNTLKMDTSALMIWEDEHLQWNPDEFFGIKKFHFTAGEIWKPDIKILNGRTFMTTPWMYGGLTVDSTGRVSWFPVALMYPVCRPFDYTNYPKDVQRCKLQLGSWTTSQNEIDLQLNEMQSNQYYFNRSNPHWEITKFEGQKLKYTDSANEPQTMLEYEIEMKRVNVPHMALDCVPDTVARILLLCMFWLPDLVKKLVAGLTSLFILTILAVSLNSLLPSPAAAPAALAETTASLGMGITAIILEIALSMLSSWTGNFPSFLSGLANTRFFLMLRSFAQKQHTFACEQPGENEPKEPDSTGAVNIRPWTVLALLIEKILFVVFCVLLLAV